MITSKIGQFIRLNADDDTHMLKQGEYLNAENIRIGVSQDGKSLAIRNIPSTTSLFNPGANKLRIGSCIDYSRQRVLWIVYDNAGNHTIYTYDLVANTTYIVLQSSQMQLGLALSNRFRPDKNLRIQGDLLFFTDYFGEPYCISIEAGIKLNQPGYVTNVQPYATPIPYTTTTLIKRPPIYNVDATKIGDVSFTPNFVWKNAYQVGYMYQYKNYQKSVISAWTFVPININNEDVNYVRIKIPFAEHVDDYVLSVDLVVRYGNTGKTVIIKSWSKDNPIELNQIIAHNSGVTQLEYHFYDNQSVIPVDDITANTPFDNVPLKALTLEIAKNRLILGNYLSGYNTPSVSSLTATVNMDAPFDYVLKTGSFWGVSIAFYDRFRRKCGVVRNGLFIYTNDRDYAGTSLPKGFTWTLSNTGALNEIPDWAYYYQILWTKNLAKSFFIQGLTQNVVYVKKNDDGTFDYSINQFSTSVYAIGINISDIVTYGLGYTFSDGDYIDVYDQAGGFHSLRILGQEGNFVLAQPVDLGILVSGLKFDVVPGAIGNFDFIGIDLANPYSEPGMSAKSVASQAAPPALSLPPNSNWAINTTDGVTRTFNITGEYVIKTNTNGQLILETFVTDPANPSGYQRVELARKDGAVAGTTYTFTINAVVAIPNPYTKLFIIQFGSAGMNMEVISGTLYFGRAGAYRKFEIYTPYQSSESEKYYEASPVYNITNPTLNTRVYSTLTGFIKGDAYTLTRPLGTGSYVVEVMSPNDAVWKDWERDLGWPNVIDNIGQQLLDTNFKWSDTFINGSKTNGLNKFQALNEKDIGNSSGSIQKLQLTNKQQEDGNVMLILAEQAPLSAYLQEVQLLAAAQNDAIVQTDDFVGTINPLRNGYGTLNPESVIEYNGLVWWVSTPNGIVCQYSVNGVDPISDFKMQRFFDRYCKRYINGGFQRLDNPIHTGIDASTDELLISLPQVENAAQNLPSYNNIVPSYASSIQNRFDIYDGLAKTMVYKTIENTWKEAVQWMPEGMEYLGSKFYAFKNGVLYLHNESTTSYNTIYGVQYPQRFCFFVNANNPSAIKDMLDISIEGNGVIPKYTVLYSKYPYEQITDLAFNDVNSDGTPKWGNLEGVMYASFFKDRLSPNISGSVEQKMMEGDIVTSSIAMIMVEFQEYNTELIINFINTGFEISRGQLQLLQSV